MGTVTTDGKLAALTRIVDGASELFGHKSRSASSAQLDADDK
jgi:hypothetical protein